LFMRLCWTPTRVVGDESEALVLASVTKVFARRKVSFPRDHESHCYGS
jgi:hypothetical protein